MPASASEGSGLPKDSASEERGQHAHGSGPLSIHTHDSESDGLNLEEKRGLPSEQDDLDHQSVDPQNAAELGRSRTQSRASSTRSRPLLIVPRAERRGILSQLTLVPEVVNPYDYKRSTKWGITASIAIATAAAPLGSSIFYRLYHPIQLDLALQKETNFDQLL